MATAKEIIKQAESWIGCKESNGTHKKIIDVYNAHKPLARGYAVKYTDSWCATFVSAVAIKCGATNIIPTECGCEKQIELFKKLGVWIENENRVPAAGNIIYYHWDDNGTGDCKGFANHVGIVQKVVDKTIYVIEGNYNNAVGVRKIAINAKGIRGFATPKYDKEVVKTDNKPEEYAKTAVDWAIKNKILLGTENGDYMLHSNITRQDFLVMLYRALH